MLTSRSWFVKLLLLTLLATPVWAATIHVLSTDSATAAIAKIEGADCGDTVIYDTQAQRTLAAGTMFRLYLAQVCPAGSPLVIQAQDHNNPPLFDFSGFPIDINHRLGTLNASGTTLTWVSCTDSPSSICAIDPFYAAYVGDPITLNGSVSCTIATWISSTQITVSGCSPGTLTGATYDIQLDNTSGHCGLIPGTYHLDDCSRQAWFMDTTSYVTLDGFHIKGATSTVDENTAAVRDINGSHNTLRYIIAELSYAGLYEAGMNDILEYNQLLNNGFYGNEQSHNIYLTGGDNVTVRYSYLTAVNCCIRIDGSVSPGTGGQNIHFRAWHGDFYGNWFESPRQYQFDMYNPLCNSIPGCSIPVDNTMRLNLYNNVFNGAVEQDGQAKEISLFNFEYADPTVITSLDAEWNTFIMNYAHNYDHYLLQFDTDITAIAGIYAKYVNNVLYQVPGWSGTKGLIIISYDSGSAWGITGNNNWFGNTINGNTCSSTYTVGNGSCYLPTQSTGTSAAFANFGSVDYSPASSGVFGAADTTQTLKGTISQTAPMVFVTRDAWSDRGAIQYGTPSTVTVTFSGVSLSGVSKQ